MESSRDAGGAVPDAVVWWLVDVGVGDPDEVKKMIENMYGK